MSVIKFGAWQDLSGNEVANSTDPVGDGGLVHIKTQTIGSGVSSVTVTNVFSSTFDNYKVIASGINCTVFGTPFYLRFGSGATYYHSYWDQSTVTTVNGGSDGVVVGATGTGAPIVGFEAILGAPYLAQRSTIQGMSLVSLWYGGGQDTDTTPQTGFTIRLTSGTFTGGNIRVYGYRN